MRGGLVEDFEGYILVNHCAYSLELSLGLLAFATSEPDEAAQGRRTEPSEQQEARPDTRGITGLASDALA